MWSRLGPQPESGDGELHSTRTSTSDGKEVPGTLNRGGGTCARKPDNLIFNSRSGQELCGQDTTKTRNKGVFLEEIGKEVDDSRNGSVVGHEWQQAVKIVNLFLPAGYALLKAQTVEYWSSGILRRFHSVQDLLATTWSTMKRRMIRRLRSWKII